MKIRNGFVSNSSSSSFVCEVCGSEYISYDVDLSDANLVICKSGHCFCIDHIVKKDNYKFNDSDTLYTYDEMLTYSFLDDEEENIEPAERVWEFPTEFCPICNFEHIPDNILLEYIQSVKNIKLDEIKSEIKNNYKNLDEMSKKLNMFTD